MRRNCPGATEIAGTPSSGTTTPGVEIMKLRVGRALIALHAYVPAPAILRGKWKVPKLERVN